MNILLVEGDHEVAALLADAMRRAGHRVASAGDGQDALDRWQAEPSDLVVLDVSLAKLNGFEVCRRMRQDDASTPIVLLSGRKDEADVLHGFALGADDYVTRPFSVKQLLARLEALRRRREASSSPRRLRRQRVGDLVVDLQTSQVTKAGAEVQVTPLEFRILSMLAINAGQTIPYATLISYAWGHSVGDASLVKSHIRNLRKKLHLPRQGPGSLTATRGVGYRLASS